jgi:addiction module HigA family antidote
MKSMHPGEHLSREFMKPLGLSSYKVAKAIGVSIPTVNEIVRKRRAVTAQIAMRFSLYFGTSAEYWQGLQAGYDLKLARQRLGRAGIKKVKPLSRREKLQLRRGQSSSKAT